MAACGSKFNHGLLPSESRLFFRRDPDIARAVIKAVQRARLISYLERSILPKSAFRNPDDHSDPRDEHCIHLILHRRNSLSGAIRCQFHRKLRSPEDPEPLFSEIMSRASIGDGLIREVEATMSSAADASSTYMEVSGWLMNPDFPRNMMTGILLPAAVWGLGLAFKEFHGIATLRASNSAASTLLRLGGDLIRIGSRDMRFDDSFYRGTVQLMRMRSFHYTREIETIVKYSSTKLSESGILQF